MTVAVLWPSPGQASLGNGGKTLLIVNSYQESSPWSNTIISELTEYGATRMDLDVFTEHMNVLMIGDRERLDEYRCSFSESYAMRRPDAVIVLGNPAFRLLGGWMRANWGEDLPIILCAEEEYTGSEDAYLFQHFVPPAERVPLAELTDSVNLTLLYAPIYLEESVGLMRRMLPSMERLIFINDERYINRQTDYDLEELIRREHPDLEYRSYSAGRMTLDRLFDSLQTVNPQRDGLLFSSWFTKREIGGNTVLSSGSYKVIAGFLLPVFSIHYAGMEESGLVGGYIYDRAAYEAQLLETVEQVFAGRQPRDIPFYRPAGRPVFNYPSMRSRGLDPGLTPKGTAFIDRPESFFSRYRWPILLSLLAVVGFILLQQWRISVLGRIRRAKEQEAESAARYANLFRNMPILYMQERVVFDATGRPVDTVFADVNNRFLEGGVPRGK